MYDVFLSYRRGKGSDLASYFDSELKKNGFSTYLDIDSNTGNFEEIIKDEIKNSKLFVLIITEGSLERFASSNDISRIELEAALTHNIPVLPISVIGDKMFEVIQETPHLPECVLNLKKLNTRFYKHELRQDTLTYLIELVSKIRIEIYHKVANEALDLVSVLEDEVLLNYISQVKEQPFNFKNTLLLYTGNLKYGNPCGNGILVDPYKGLIYTAEWSPYEKFSGHGKVEFNGKLVYEGEFVQLKYDGQGLLITDTYTFKGPFREGKINGTGIMTYNDGTVITGKFLAENCYSVGHIIYPDGTSYYGKLYENKPYGLGVYNGKDNIKYDGEFQSGNITNGAIYYPDYVYLGNIKNLSPNGKGNMYTKEFRKMYEGGFKSGMANGNGTFFITGDFLSKGIVPKEIYLSLKSFYSELDSMKLLLKGYFLDNNLNVNDDFSIINCTDSAIILEGRLKAHDNPNYKIFSNHETVYTSEAPQTIFLNITSEI